MEVVSGVYGSELRLRVSQGGIVNDSTRMCWEHVGAFVAMVECKMVLCLALVAPATINEHGASSCDASCGYLGEG